MKNEYLNGLLRFCPDFNTEGFTELILQLGVNMAVLLVISYVLYFRYNRNAAYMFAQLISGMIVFMICALLRWIRLELGLVLGLFAIFAIIRFRTTNVPVKEMAYLFMVVGISAVNALLPADRCLQWILITNTLMVVITYLLERIFFSHPVSGRNIIWDNLELLRPEKHTMLLHELSELTGLKILRFDIGKTDYIKKHVQIRIYYRSNRADPVSDDNINDDD